MSAATFIILVILIALRRNCPWKVNEVMGNRDDTDSITIELKRTSGAQAKQMLEQLLTIDGVQEDASSQ